MAKPTIEELGAQLDKWVAKQGSGHYADNAIPLRKFAVLEDYGIQQDRQEILDFAAMLLKESPCKSVMEIGLGYFGSTHFLWRLIFDEVTSVEKAHDRIRHFGTSMRDFYGKWVLNDGKSSFLIGYSYEPATLKKAYDGVSAPGLDLLFIDADHSYESVLSDWANYAPLVRKGGIVAFHDVMLTIPGYYGVPEFVKKLSEGGIDGNKHDMKFVAHTKNMGIGYYIKQ